MKLKLKTTITITLILFTVIPFIVMGTVGAFAIFGSATHQNDEKNITIATAKSTRFKLYFKELNYMISGFSKSEVVSLATKGGDSEVKTELNAMIADISKNQKSVIDVIVMQKDGTIITDLANADLAEGTTKKGEMFFGFGSPEMFSSAEKGPYFSDIILNDANNKYLTDFFYILAEVKNEEEITGYTAVVADIKYLNQILKEANLEGSADVTVSDRKGTFISLDSEGVTKLEEIKAKSFENSISRIIGNPPVNHTEESKHNERNLIDLGGVRAIYGNIENTNGWFWLGIRTTSDAETIAAWDTYSYGFYVLACFVLLGVVISLVLAHITTAPMKELISHMELVKKDKRNQRLHLKGETWEFGQMCNTFNFMLEKAVFSEELHRTIASLSNSMLFEWDFVKAKMYVSDNFTHMFDINSNNATLLNGRFIDSCMDEHTSKKYRRDINEMLKNKSCLGAEYQVKTNSGNIIWISLKVQCMCDRVGNINGVIGVVTDIDVEKKINIKLSERASYDFLSQLYNRSTFERELQNELERNCNNKVAVMFIDVDDFKKVNDEFGHSVGDEVIKYIANIVKSKVDGVGFAGRFGGDEFVLCVTDQKTLRAIDLIAMEIIDELKRGYFSKTANALLKIKASIGVAISPEHETYNKQIIANADAAMYQVKKSGKNNFYVFNEKDFPAAD